MPTLRTKNRLLSTLVLCCLILVSAEHSSVAQFVVPTPTVVEGLKTHAPRNFFIGGVVHGDASFNDAGYRAVAERDFNAVTSTAYMPWGVWEDPKQNPDFSKFNSVVDWAGQRGMQVHGHTMVFPWANEQIDWWKRIPASLVEKYLKHYVVSAARTRAGRIWSWDVVNEVMANDGEPMDVDGLRTQYKEYRSMGPSYVDKAFHWAASTDPNAKLILNTTGCERLCGKSNRLYNYALKLKARGVPVHGIGFQTHFVDVTSPAPDIASMRQNFQRFANAGFEIHITEIDVCSIRTKNPHPHHPGVSTPNRQQLDRQKLHFEQTLQLALSMPAVKSFLFWDYADDFSWLHKTTSQIVNVPKDTYTYPTPFWGGKACAIAPKPAYHGMLNVMRTTPKIDR